MSDKKDSVLIETPVEIRRPKVSRQSTVAAGAAGVFSSFKIAFKQMGFFRSAKALTAVNHKDGFDCPSCAWPDPDDRRSLVEFCENGAKAVADEATRKRITPEFFAKHSLSELSQLSDYELGQNGRLAHPMVKRPQDTHYKPIEWNQAFDLIATELNSLQSPNEAAFYTSGRTSNEAAFIYQLFARSFGTNNLPDCSNMCHESSGAALSEQIGIGKGTVKLTDFDHADCIIVAGQNPGTNHPRMLTALQRAVRNGCKIISINPLKETGLTAFKNPQEVMGWLGRSTPLATLFLPVRINGDVALIKGLIKIMLENEKSAPSTVLDLEFIKSSTIHFDDLANDIEKTSWDEILKESGIAREDIQKAAFTIGASKNIIICWAMGLTQHKNAVGTIQMYTNILLMKGSFGRPGSGACPVRGHSNVQGDRTMGIYEKMPEPFHQALEKEFNFKSPRAHGFDTVDTIKAMHLRNVKVFFGMGGNFQVATPDTEYTAEALKKCKLTVHVSTKLNRAHLVTGETALILPCLGRTEIDLQESGTQFVSVEDSMSLVHQSHGNLKPGSEFLKSEVAIVCGLAKATLKKNTPWNEFENNYDRIRESISRVIPGCENYNERVRKLGGFYLPNPPRDSRTFKTDTGKGQFKIHPIAKTTPPQGRFILMTIRSHDQFNTTIYGLDDRYRGIKKGRRVIFMNPEDMKEQSLAPHDAVNVTSHFKGQNRTAPHFVVVPYEIPKQCVATYFPEGNVLVPIESVAEISNTPAYKSIEVSLTRISFKE